MSGHFPPKLDDGQHTHEEMPHVVSHRGNANPARGLFATPQAVIRKGRKGPSAGEDAEGPEPSTIAHENTEGAPLWEHLGALHMPPGVPLLGIHPKKDKGVSDDLCSIIHNSQNVKATQGSEDRWAGQQNVAHPFRGALFPRELKAGPTPASWKSLEDVILSEMSQRDRVWFHR